MVLQRDAPVPVWGWAAPGAMVTVAFAGQAQTAVADAAGRWRATLTPLAASHEPRVLTVSCPPAEAVITCADVLVGEVWLCSGQSNMGIPVHAAAAPERVLAEAEDRALRWFCVEPDAAAAPAADVGGQWVASTAATAAAYSAVAWGFGHRLRQTLGVPVGLLHASRGGTVAEGWIPEETLRIEPALRELLGAFDRDRADPEAARRRVAAERRAWDQTTAPHDPGNTGWRQGWAAPTADLRDWSPMRLPGYWQAAGHPYSGVFWFRKTVEIPAAWAGQALRLQLGACDKSEVTYFNGVEVGSLRIEDRPDAWSLPRDYRIPPELVQAGRAVIAVRVFSHMHAGGMAGPAADMRLAPAGAAAAEALPLAGEWAYRVEHNLGYTRVPPAPSEPLWPVQPHTPGALFNAMIAPLAPYALRGALWYQGESNADHRHPEWYGTLLPLLIRSWRQAWGREFAFHLVQLPNFKDVCATPAESAWAEVREVQRLALREPATGLAVTIDLGEAADLHPPNKRDVAERLALSALAKTYRVDGIVGAGPMIREAQAEDGAVRLTFEAERPLLCRGDRLMGFALAGADGVFAWAEAVIEGNTVRVANPAIPRPVTVRYAWADNPVCNLYDAGGLPASPFQVAIVKTPAGRKTMNQQTRRIMAVAVACGLAADPAAWFERDVVLPEGWKEIAVERLFVRGSPRNLTARHGQPAHWSESEAHSDSRRLVGWSKVGASMERMINNASSGRVC
jgi:sialate O-acetylesterase